MDHRAPEKKSNQISCIVWQEVVGDGLSRLIPLKTYGAQTFGINKFSKCSQSLILEHNGTGQVLVNPKLAIGAW